MGMRISIGFSLRDGNETEKKKRMETEMVPRMNWVSIGLGLNTSPGTGDGDCNANRDGDENKDEMSMGHDAAREEAGIASPLLSSRGSVQNGNKMDYG